MLEQKQQTNGKFPLLERGYNNPYSHEDIKCSYSIHVSLKSCIVMKYTIASLSNCSEKKGVLTITRGMLQMCSDSTYVPFHVFIHRSILPHLAGAEQRS